MDPPAIDFFAMMNGAGRDRQASSSAKEAAKSAARDYPAKIC
jgi:hypothetical protein